MGVFIPANWLTNCMNVTARAHPNIALIKYWGKLDTARNLPAVSSLSITLDTLCATTTLSEVSSDDRLLINGDNDEKATRRVARCLDTFRELAGSGARACVDSVVNFPVAAGLASSAAGFAALVVAADQFYQTGLPRHTLARIAGNASGSAARSLYGGFVQLDAPHSAADDIAVREVLPAATWPLAVVIAVTASGPKSIGSTEAMLASEKTSPYFSAWVESQDLDMCLAGEALANRDFQKLAEVSEASCLKMHALTQSSRPGIIYWNAATQDLIHAVRRMRADGVGVFFTIDAGPQLKAICLPGDADKVAAALQQHPGVESVLRTGLGEAAHRVS